MKLPCNWEAEKVSYEDIINCRRNNLLFYVFYLKNKAMCAEEDLMNALWNSDRVC